MKKHIDKFQWCLFVGVISMIFFYAFMFMENPNKVNISYFIIFIVFYFSVNIFICNFTEESIYED